jgi:hypothetical protein
MKPRFSLFDLRGAGDIEELKRRFRKGRSRLVLSHPAWVLLGKGKKLTSARRLAT